MKPKRAVIREDGKVYESTRAAADSVCGDQTNISRACRNQNRTAYGYSWRYAEEFEMKSMKRGSQGSVEYESRRARMSDCSTRAWIAPSFYRFPAIPKHAHARRSLSIIKLYEEVGEAEEAARLAMISPSADNMLAYAMELLDIIHAAETALRVDFDESQVLAAQEAVIAKNRERGYYDEVAS